MALWLALILIVAAFAGGSFLGMFLARRQMEDYLEKNPPLNEDVIRTMMSSMGQKPSEAKVQQVVRQINRQQKQAKNAKKKK
ncbi:YneF family protein [Streptococcus massiliensis]|uniref:UPF0154 protein NCTC13765_01215 n=1 Tax=Streptococcus massiliensis TaxID=313439 RepID=A0A380L021_9STRE|nr:YneF family protein [Streptococcus massiliensis]SUN76717.1 UPF0154 protein SSU98 [Streptococcus massiliensis]